MTRLPSEAPETSDTTDDATSRSAATRALGRIIEWSVEHKVLVLVATAALAIGGLWALLHTPVDAIPDLSDVQVIVMTEWPGQAPQTVEDQVTYPLSTEMLKVPRTKVVRGMSQFGLSAVYVVFAGKRPYAWCTVVPPTTVRTI